ncbi:efflux transporter periplasmic adaptor subunit [Comamonas serinivorans]|uniref:Efflux transporter periplasmic adaptor subunit n=1 Tax=Comamonas serinivorans TaxID=1082851 RepID=A0A1Y0EJG0_9BURK|nr:efflux RND transporter periplasmic adaptor subunit [Comamonas serinivorans]ARU03773.1 efflux transporter periplasmic adaptor subunit [Comamonas serinivorans]
MTPRLIPWFVSTPSGPAPAALPASRRAASTPPGRLAARRSTPAWAAGALVLALTLAGCGRSSDGPGQARPDEAASAPAAGASAAEATRPALTVSVAAPERQEWPVTLDANGNVAAWQEASVGSESNGLRLAEVRVNVGDVVKRGQVLAVFSGDTVRADVAQAQASLVEAQANAADAQGNAERARALAETGALSQQQINQYQTAAKTAQARVEAARAVLAAQQVRGRNVQVLAPDDGIISARSATVGSVLSAGTELFRLIRQGRLEWRAEVPAHELEKIQPGQRAELVLPSGSSVQGTVRAVAPSLDDKTRNALVYVDLAPHAGVKAGMFARGRFELGRQAALTVPQVAVVPRDGFNHVLVVAADNRVRLHKVQLGRRLGERVELLEALPADARLVVDGAGFLNDGDLVHVVPPLPAAAASAPASGPAPTSASAASAPAAASSGMAPAASASAPPATAASTPASASSN